MKKTRDDICAPPTPTDVLYGKIIYFNRIFDGNQLEMFLDDLEYYHITGTPLSIMDVIVEENMLNPSQELIIRETYKKHIIQTNDSFLKESLKYLPKVKEAIENHNKNSDPVSCQEFLRMSLVSRRYYKVLCCYIQHFWLSEENKYLCDTLLQNEIITHDQLSEVNKKYNNFIHLGTYKCLPFLLDSVVEKNVLNLYLRAVRRSMVTTDPVEIYM